MSLRVLHLTDLHLTGDPSGTVRGMVTLASFRACLRSALQQHAHIAGLILTGDLVQDDAGGYTLLRAVLDELGLPALCLPGNHDVADAMTERLPEQLMPPAGLPLGRDWQVLPLDSTLPGEERGWLGPARLAELSARIEATRRPHLLLALHHPPVHLGSAWIDALGLEDGAELLELARQSGRVRGILWGHAHQAFDCVADGLTLMGTPSTCFQFAPAIDEFAIDPRGPGYRILELRSTGHVDTTVEWLPLQELPD